jgi:hypothetical protein
MSLPATTNHGGEDPLLRSFAELPPGVNSDSGGDELLLLDEAANLIGVSTAYLLGALDAGVIAWVPPGPEDRVLR